MRELLDSAMRCCLVEDLVVAERRAGFEAVNTSGIVAPVRAVEIGGSEVTHVVQIPNLDVEIQASPTRGRLTIKALGLGTFYLTLSSLLAATDLIGFLVVRPPIKAWGERSLMDSEVLRAAIKMTRMGRSLPTGMQFGSVCCGICNWPISSARLAAVRNTKICTRCREKDEQEIYHGDFVYADRHYARS